MFLFPMPCSVRSLGKTFDYSTRTVVKCDACAIDLRKALLRIVSKAQRQGLGRLCLAAGEVEPTAMLVELSLAEYLGKEEFTIATMEDGAHIRAGGNAGAAYALETFLKMVAENPAAVPSVDIHDKPSLPHRGYMLDISRDKVPAMDSLKQMVDALADLRCNELQLYTEHTFAFQGHERVWADSSPMTAGEIMELDAYCRERFIELVPNLNSFGHLERWLSLPEYNHLAECPVPWYWEEWEMSYQATLYPSEQALDFLKELYGQMLPCFSSSRLNIGCDETIELGKGRSAERCEREGTHHVYLDFLAKICALAADFGKSVQFWGDVILHSPELIGELPKGITAMEWGYEANHPFDDECAKFAASGVPFYVCPGTSTWNTFIGRYDNMLENISRAAGAAQKAGAVGMLITDWGDGGHQQYWPFSWPGICYGLACAWNHQCAEQQANMLPEAVGRFFDAKSGGMRLGEIIQALGNVYRIFPNETCCNSTVWGSFFCSPEKSRYSESLLEKTPLTAARESLRQLNEIQREIHDNPPSGDLLVCRELANGALMAKCAIEAMLWRKEPSAVDVRKWHDDMAHIIGEHSRLWLERNRVGGLHESSAALRAFKQRIPHL